MKTYTLDVYTGGASKEIEVLVPTPKEFQVSFVPNGKDFKILISNLSTSRKGCFSVSKLERTQDKVLLSCGIEYEMTAKGYNTISNIRHREDAVAIARDFIIGHL